MSENLLFIEKNWFLLIVIFYSIRTIRNIFYTLFLWQLKEYRLDRILSFIRSSQGKRWIFSPLSIIKAIYIVLYIIFIINYFVHFHGIIGDLITQRLGIFIILFIPTITYVIEGLKDTYALIKKHWRIPVFTLKILIITIANFVLYTAIVYYVSLSKIEFSILIVLPVFLLIDILLSPTITLWIGIFYLPKLLYKFWLLKKANIKINKYHNLKVVGITGSVGKTSTKEFAAAILSSKYKVVKTPESKNVDIAIASTILNQITPEDEIFIAEMGAYKKGEIKNICDMVHPAIGVITYIGTQHMELFGSQKNIIEAKFELIDALPPNGIAILNADNPDCVKLAEKTRTKGLKTILFGTNKNADVLAQDIKVSKDGIELNIKIKNDKKNIKTGLLGIQNIPNLLAAVSIASSIGMRLDNIAIQITKITSPSKTMQLAKTLNNTALINDTFNASIESLEAALDYMKLYTGQKILILTPLIELGDNAGSVHEKIGTNCAKICDKVLLTNPNYYQNIITGAKIIPKGEKKIELATTQKMIDCINNNTTKDSIALFEGKESARLLHSLI